MQSLRLIFLLAVAGQAHAKDSTDKLTDKLGDKLYHRGSNAPAIRNAGLDDSTVGKPGHLATPLRTGLQSRLPSPYRAGIRGTAVPGNHMQDHMVASHTSSQDAGVGESSTSGSISKSSAGLNRRTLFAGMASAGGSLMFPTKETKAIQGYTAGRLPGLADSDKEGFYRYTRPEGKQGGHGVGWSEIPRYTFLLPEGWSEQPVSIADLGGTEVDCRFSDDDKKEGDLAVVVAPILRFTDAGFGANVRIDQLGTPEKMIKGFGPEITGGSVEDKIDSMSERKVGDLLFYDYELEGHTLVTMTAVQNRCFIIIAKPKNSAQWRRHETDFRTIVETFGVQA